MAHGEDSSAPLPAMWLSQIAPATLGSVNGGDTHPHVHRASCSPVSLSK